MYVLYYLAILAEIKLHRASLVVLTALRLLGETTSLNTQKKRRSITSWQINGEKNTSCILNIEIFSILLISHSILLG